MCVSDACDPSPCSNGGVCVGAADGGYTCNCPEGYAGVNCTMAIAVLSGKWQEVFSSFFFK